MIEEITEKYLTTNELIKHLKELKRLDRRTLDLIIENNKLERKQGALEELKSIVKWLDSEEAMDWDVDYGNGLQNKLKERIKELERGEKK